MSYKPTIAVFGTSGFLGKPVLSAFESSYLADKIQLPVKAITTSSKDKSNTNTTSYVEGGDLTKEEAQKKIIDQLQGTDVIISLAGFDPQLSTALENIVKGIKPKLYIPSQFGTDIVATSEYLPGFLEGKTQHSNNVRSAGIKVVDVITSLFAVEGSLLYEYVDLVGINTIDKTVTYAGSPQTKFAISKLSDIGHAVASLASIEPTKLPDTARIQSDEITYEDVVKKYQSTHNVNLEVKNISLDEILKQAQEKLNNGFDGKDFLFYLNAIAAQGVDKGLSFSKTENELVNPGEKYWTWDKY